MGDGAGGIIADGQPVPGSTAQPVRAGECPDGAFNPSRRRRGAWLGAFVSLLFLWLLLFLWSGSLTKGASPKGLGGDFVLFLSAARTLQHGGNPYDQAVLYRSERSLLSAQGMRAPAFDPYMRVGNPPLLFWALTPVSRLPFRTLAPLWCAAMYLCCALGFLGCLVFLEWRRLALPVVLLLAMPQTMYAAYYGNVDGLVVIGLGGAAAVVRRRPFLAGLILSSALLKPQVALPGACLIALFLSPVPWRSFAGLVGGIVGVIVACMVTAGTASIGWWLHALTGYSERLAVQPDIASLAGLYVYTASTGLRILLEGASLALALGASAVFWLRGRNGGTEPPLAIAWLWILWFLATPFAHFHDEVVLALPVLAMLGRNAQWIGRWPPTVALYALLLSIVLFPASRAQTDFQSLALAVVLVCAVVQSAAIRRGVRRGASSHPATQTGHAGG